MVESLQATWKFAQCFGDKGDIDDITDADIISAVEFDHSGNYLATGDKGGRVVLFERNHAKKGCEYKFYTEFQSHEPEFDYLKSLEIEEKINKIKWCKRRSDAHFLLSTNDKTIKLWKVFTKHIKVVAENNLSHSSIRNTLNPSFTNNNNISTTFSDKSSNNNDNKNSSSSIFHHSYSPADIARLRLPRTTLHDTIIAASPRKIYANAHAYHINSISVNSDDETFLSADDLRINLWNLGISDKSFNIVDIKPANMEELTEVITAAEFHPTSCNYFIYSSSKGTIKLADMRESALCDVHAKLFEEDDDPNTRSFFSEIISSISDVRFSPNGRYIVSRDYLTVKIWDIAMEREPVKTINIHEHLQSRLCDTYENEAIFDKFEVEFSGDGKSVMTGSYNNNFMIYPNAIDFDAQDTEIVLQADKSAFKAKKVGVAMPIGGGNNGSGKSKYQNSPPGRNSNGISSPTLGANGLNTVKRDLNSEAIDFKKKILHISWHPHEDSIAIAATNNLFVFSTL